MSQGAAIRRRKQWKHGNRHQAPLRRSRYATPKKFNKNDKRVPK